MKIVIIADDKDILTLNRIHHAEDLTQLATSDTRICLLSNIPNVQELEKLKNQGFSVITLAELIRQSVLVSPPSFEDILQRKESSIDLSSLQNFYRDKVIVVTGGEGFIGNEIVDCLLTLPVKQVVAYGHDENKAYELTKKYFDEKRFQFILGDIRDQKKLDLAFSSINPHIIYHAAAHKHVPILESYPEEAVKTNILGTKNVADIAIKLEVERFVLISTDKAVNPSSALGASKRIAEKICLSMDAYSKTRFITVRFGNVFGSTGSVVPTFLQQIAEDRPLTITDKNMVRYFMSVYEAVKLVLLSVTTEEGNLFTLDMGEPISIGKLAQNLLAHIGLEFSDENIQIIGNRGGEKFAEELIHSFDQILPSIHKKLITLKDCSPIWDECELSQIYHEFLEASKKSIRKDIFDLFDKYIIRYAKIGL